MKNKLRKNTYTYIIEQNKNINLQTITTTNNYTITTIITIIKNIMELKHRIKIRNKDNI